MMFDRVIFLSDGHTIYNGPPEQIAGYFKQFGLKQLSHTNPADKMSIIAANPRMLLRENITIYELAKACEKQLSGNQHLRLDLKTQATSILSRRFTLIDDQRKVSACRQFSLLF